MGKTVKAVVRGFSYTVEIDCSSKGRTIAEDVFDFYFPIYIVDDNYRLVYLEQFFSGKEEIKRDTEIINIKKHSSTEEVYDIVEIIDEDSGEKLKILKNVNLIGILEGIKEVFDEQSGSGNSKGTKESSRKDKR